ncbi:betaine/proline/choline family ABC transporter ATP-binding protein [soil metagenome]
MSAIRFENVTKEFSNMARSAVDHCSLEVDKGQFIVLLGPSGCGKTTLLKMVNRLYEPSSGTIYLDGVDIRQLNVNKLRRQIGYVIQQTGLFPHMTVAQNIATVPNLLRWPKQQTDQRVDELLALVDLPPAEYRTRYPAQLSGGQQQRVGVARALAGNPEFILMDEPFGAVDAITRMSLQDEMITLQKKLRKTILFVTHDVDEALRLADKIVIMRGGKIVQYDTPLNILNHPADAFVKELMGGGDIVRQLGLMRVEVAMHKLPPDFHADSQPTISCEQDLRHALSLLLQPDTTTLLVMDQQTPVGLLTLDDLRAASGEQSSLAAVS